MPTEIIKALPVKDFLPYAELGQRNQALESRLPLFLAKLVGATQKKTVETLVEEEKIWLRSLYSPASIPNRLSKYRTAVQACFREHAIPDGLEYQQMTKDGLVTLHSAMAILTANPDETAAAAQRGKTKTDADQDNPQPFDLWRAVEAAEIAVKSRDWREVCAGLMFACQARPIDILKLGSAKAVGKHKIEFTTQAKKKGKSITKTINTIVDASTFVDALNLLRRDTDVTEVEHIDNSRADSQKNSSINRAVAKVFGEIIPPPFTEKFLTAHNLRAAGSLAAFHLFAGQGISQQRYVTEQLIHDSAAMASNYDDYYCTDEDGKEITEKGIHPDKDRELETMPKSQTKSSLTVDRQLPDEMDTFGLIKASDKENYKFETRSDQLVHIIALARKAAELEKQLAYQVEQNKKLRDTIASAPKTAPVEAEYNTTEPAAMTATTAADPRSIPNAELLGSKKRGAAEERLRRTVEAIQEYNAGRDLSEQIAINKGSLRKLAGVNVKRVNDWVDENAAELDQYTDAQGHGFRQNVGKDLSVIKWSEAAYGPYEWPEGYFE